jgi:hypothetical protein
VATGCDLASDPWGPPPEDFEVQEETSAVRATDDEAGDIALRPDVAAPLSTARGGGSTRSLEGPR